MNCGCHSHGSFLTAAGYAAVAQRERELLELDGMGPERYVDKVGSVSALVEVEDDFEYDPNHHELNRRVIPHGT